MNMINIRCLLYSCVSSPLRVCVCVCVLHALTLCHLVLACCRLVWAPCHLLSVVGVSPAHLAKKTSKLAWFSHSSESQDGMCASKYRVSVTCVYMCTRS